MSTEIIVRGDHLPVLVPLTVVQASGSDLPQALVWGLDLGTERSRHAAQKRLRRVGQEVADYSAAQPGLRYLFVVYTHGGSLPEGSCLGAAAQAATRLHAEFERSRGREIDVVTLDVTGWEDGGVVPRPHSRGGKRTPQCPRRRRTRMARHPRLVHTRGSDESVLLDRLDAVAVVIGTGAECRIRVRAVTDSFGDQVGHFLSVSGRRYAIAWPTATLCVPVVAPATDPT